MKRYNFYLRFILLNVTFLVLASLPDYLYAAGSTSGSAPGILSQLFGRLHPLIVHLPIGILFIAYLLEIFSGFNRFNQLKPAVTFALVFGSITAVAAVSTGWFLSQEGGYNESTLGRHKWLAIAVAVSALLATIIKLLPADKRPARISQSYKYLLSTNALLLIFAGHFGGNLTHGSTYLTSLMPEPVRTLLQGEDTSEPAGTIVPVDVSDPVVFAQTIQPILDDKCTSCHNPDKRKGKLEMHNAEAISAGGENGPVIIAGDIEESELYYRITLPANDDEHMPPDGKKQLTDSEIKLIGWWISEGASFDAPLSTFEIPADIEVILDNQTTGEGTSMPADDAGVFKMTVPPADTAAVEKLRELGVHVMPVSQQSNLLTVQYRNISTLTDSSMEALLPLAEQVTWLDLSRTGISDSSMVILSQLKHLTRLHLENTRITDKGLQNLESLQYLEYLNLYGTRISEQGLQALTGLKRLKSLYLWQTNVKPEHTKALASHLPNTDINLGYVRKDSVTNK